MKTLGCQVTYDQELGQPGCALVRSALWNRFLVAQELSTLGLKRPGDVLRFGLRMFWRENLLMLPVGPRGLEPAECVFNRGVFVMDVRRWKKLQITREIERWMARYRESKKDPGWRRNLFWTIHSRNELDHWKATAQESYLRASGIPVTRLVSFRTYTSSGSLSPRGFLLCTTDTAISAVVLDERTGSF